MLSQVTCSTLNSQFVSSKKCDTKPAAKPLFSVEKTKTKKEHGEDRRQDMMWCDTRRQPEKCEKNAEKWELCNRPG